ncbi:3-keto-5-aminohexanoate cleavage protein [Lutimaribacter marinistellae]|uniref:3-keto-5-aminohexanoate cleavage protein n=1 Tax=Lutimaribacter marinistellae TaxID=1820329 RepID=A0ABV7TLY9_9RHOB
MTFPHIMVAPNGARRQKSDHPALPISLNEIIATARDCQVAGASSLHLHVRDDEGRHSLDPARYAEALDALAAIEGLAVQITTESAGLYSPEEQYECLARLRPGWASVSVREINRDPDIAPRVYSLCADEGIRVQHIAYDGFDLELLSRWRSEGIVRKTQDEVIVVLGAYAPPRPGHPQDLAGLLPLIGSLRFGLCAFGPMEQSCLAAAARSGAEILRVGFENNLTAPDGTSWTDNAAAVTSLRNELEWRAA